MQSSAISVTTSPTIIVEKDNIFRTVYVHSANGSLYLGGSAVTVASGLHLPNGNTISIDVPLGQRLYAIANSGTVDARVLTPDLD